MADDYTVLKLTQGALITECSRCGAVVFHKAIHDAWHATNDNFEKSVARTFLELIKRIKGVD